MLRLDDPALKQLRSQPLTRIEAALATSAHTYRQLEQLARLAERPTVLQGVINHLETAAWANGMLHRPEVDQ